LRVHLRVEWGRLQEYALAAAKVLITAGIEATASKLYPEYAEDYAATFFEDPDGIRLEVTNYRNERRERHDNWPRKAE
jgi:glyoxylase I family protein